jgi:hypothetical protein
MLPKRCVHCKTMFIPRLLGLLFVFCPHCTHLCEQACLRIEDYLKDHPAASHAKIAMDLGIPSLFVSSLYQLGRLSAALPTHKTVDRRTPCTICRKRLKPEENVICTICEDVIKKRMHSRYRAYS